MKSGMTFQPPFDVWSFVRGVVIQDQMNFQLAGYLPIDCLQKLDPLLVTVPLRAMGKYFAFQVIQGGEERQSAMTVVIMRAGGYVPLPQREARLTPFQCLALAFLVATEHDRLLGRSQIQPNNIPELLFELLIIGQFERAGLVRF